MFLKNYLKDKSIASVTPSSSFTVRKVCSKIDFNKDNVIVEYGPGTGVFTRFILRKMSKQSKLILIETNRNFVYYLKKINDPRILIFNDNAENINTILSECEEPSADYVISGIPFSFLSYDLKNKIIHNTSEALSRKGKFLVYQFFNHIKEPLKKRFVNVETEFEMFNIPPMFIYEASNKGINQNL